VVWTVGELTVYLKSKLEGDSSLARLAVKGEISNFVRSSAGHCYFVLKDRQAQVSCVLFLRSAAKMSRLPADGELVMITGRLTVYEPRGRYQIVVDEIRPEGLGELFLAYQRLKEKLEREGLFDPARKRPLPLLPAVVGVVTSLDGAALHDILMVSRRRNPAIRVLISGAMVQGAPAPASLIQALERLRRRGGVDVVIIGRGGGSFEELNAFNDESLARAISAFPVPVISAVGHETDFTIADFVADLRASTPSAAAETVFPSRDGLLGNLEHFRQAMRAALQARAGSAIQRLGGLSRRLSPALQRRLALGRQGMVHTRHNLERAMENILSRARSRLAAIEHRPVLLDPGRLVERPRQSLDEVNRRLERVGTTLTHSRFTALDSIRGRLAALSPLAVLERGYAICRLLSDGAVVRNAAQVMPGDRVGIRVAKGEFSAVVDAAEQEQE